MYTISPWLFHLLRDSYLSAPPQKSQPVIYSQPSDGKPSSVFSHMAPSLLSRSSCLPLAPPTPVCAL